MKWKRKSTEDIEKAIVFNNNINNKRFGVLENSVKMAIDALQSNNKLINQLMEDNKKLEARIVEVENFARQLIEKNKAASAIIDANKKK
ncbi:MAG: hypothetical protein K9J13_04065 [Saprospiraceae bacterium]|nr:hypothetical protein [Saprospiraceae bacterium]